MNGLQSSLAWLIHGRGGRHDGLITRDHTKVSREQRRIEQMDKLRRTLAKSERKRRAELFVR